MQFKTDPVLVVDVNAWKSKQFSNNQQVSIFASAHQNRPTVLLLMRVKNVKHGNERVCVSKCVPGLTDLQIPQMNPLTTTEQRASPLLSLLGAVTKTKESVCSKRRNCLNETDWSNWFVEFVVWPRCRFANPCQRNKGLTFQDQIA